MSYVIAAPEMMTAAATDLAGIGSALSKAHTAAAPTVALVPAAADEVSAGVAHLFSRYAEDFHALVGKAAAVHGQFVQHLTASAGAYAGAEAANASSLLHPLAASAGSIGGAIGAFLDPLVSSFNTAFGQTLNSLTNFWNSLTGFFGILFLFSVAVLFLAANWIRELFGLPPIPLPITPLPFPPYS